MKQIAAVVTTSGTGLWSERVADVKLKGYDVPYCNDTCDFGELCVYFNPKSWNVKTDGLIYTDPAFLEHIRILFGTNDIEYSEQGMQRSSYVSFDVGAEFLMMYPKGL